MSRTIKKQQKPEKTKRIKLISEKKTNFKRSNFYEYSEDEFDE